MDEQKERTVSPQHTDSSLTLLTSLTSLTLLTCLTRPTNEPPNPQTSFPSTVIGRPTHNEQSVVMLPPAPHFHSTSTKDTMLRPDAARQLLAQVPARRPTTNYQRPTTNYLRPARPTRVDHRHAPRAPDQRPSPEGGQLLPTWASFWRSPTCN